MVVLGGSNVVRGVATIVEIARKLLGGPVDFLFAMGHGRSYGRRSTVLGRSLPGIVECGLWKELDQEAGRPTPPTYALVTDIGNDVMYGAPVATIGQWLEACLDRLAAAGARIVMTRLPMASIERLSPLRYHVARTILFPAHGMTMADAVAGARDLDDVIRGLGARPGVRLAEQDGRWFGVDPIHIRKRHEITAWKGILGGWEEGGGEVRVRPSALRWARLRLLTPQKWWLLGRERGRPQPAGHLPDGSTISLF